MNVKQLKEMLKGLPDSAEVMIEADHGQVPEYGGTCAYTLDNVKECDNDEIVWAEDVDKEGNLTYYKDVLEDYELPANISKNAVTAVLIW